MLVSNQLVKEEIRKEILKIPQDKQNGNVPKYLRRNKMEMYQHLWDVTKEIVRGKFKAINAYVMHQ